MEGKKKGLSKKWVGLGLVVFLTAFVILTLIIMVVNSKKPDRLPPGTYDKKVKGAAFLWANRTMVEQMEGKWLPNDLFWPTVFLDNMPNFQMGQLEVVRYNVRVLRDNLSRMRTTDKLDPEAEGAFTALANDPKKWWFPSAESKWRLAQKHLKAFYEEFLKGNSHFYPRADNLVELLNQYVSLMGGANTRLINAPHDLDEVLHVDDEESKGSGESQAKVDTYVPWHRIDDNFYYAQGVAYALYESFKAIRVDFIEVLKDKNSVGLVDKILENLRRCYFEPLIVFNGSPESIFANHSLNLSGVFNDARQKIASLIIALRQG